MAGANRRQRRKHPITASARAKGKATGWRASASERKEWQRMLLASVGFIALNTPLLQSYQCTGHKGQARGKRYTELANRSTAQGGPCTLGLCWPVSMKLRHCSCSAVVVWLLSVYGALGLIPSNLRAAVIHTC